MYGTPYNLQEQRNDIGNETFGYTQKPPCCKCTKIRPPKMKKKKKRNYERTQLEEELYPTYEPCVHLHFKQDLVDRECLTHDQYLDMLATPKGYRWMGEIDCDNPELDIQNNKKKKRRKPRKREPQEVRPDAGDFADEFVEDMWDVMSPEITDRLIDFLVNEFGMSVQEAEDFVDCKSVAGKQTVCKKKKSKTMVGFGPKHKWVKDFSDVFSKRVEQYIVSMLMNRRTPRAKRIAERILEYLCDLTGEKTTLHSPKTKVQRTMVLISDRLALWIDDLIKDIDKPSKARPSITEEEVPESEEEEEEEKEPEEEGEGEEKKDEPAKKEPKGKKEIKKEEEAPADEAGDKAEAKEEEKPAEESEPDEKPEPEPVQEQPQEEERPPVREPEPEPEPVAEPPQDEPQEEAKEPDRPPPPPPPQEEEEAQEAVAEEPTQEEEPAPEEPTEEAAEVAEGEEKEEEEGEKAEAEAEEEGGETVAEEVPAVEEEEQPEGEKEAVPAEEEPSEKIPSEKPEEEEPVKKPYADIFDIIKEDIAGAPKDKRTDRQKAIKDVVDRRIEKIMGKGLLGEVPSEDVDDAASQVAHWVEQIMGATETKEDVIRRKGPSVGGAFQVRPKTGSTLEVQKLSSGTVAEATAAARGLPPPPRGRKIPASVSPMNVQSAQEWVEWANNIATVAEEWGNWLDTKVTDAEKHLADKKKETVETDWKQWKEQAQHEAVKWKVEKERIRDEGRLWNKKINEKLKQQPEQEVRSTELETEKE